MEENRNTRKPRGNHHSGHKKSTVSSKQILKDHRDKRKGALVTELENLDVDAMYVTQGALKAFKDRHGGGDRAAIEGVRDTLDALIEQGNYRVEDDGAGILWSEGYRVAIDEKGGKVFSYSTVHKERTLLQVRAGVASRAKDKPVGPRGLVARLDDKTINSIVLPWSILSKAGKDPADREDLRNEVLDAISFALDDLEDTLSANPEVGMGSGRITPGYECTDRGQHHFTSEGWDLWLRADGLRVVVGKRISEEPESEDAGEEQDENHPETGGEEQEN